MMSCLALLWLSAWFAPPADFEAAVLAYEAGDYAAAAADFGSLASEEPDVARRALLHANAGTAAARDEQLGLALWHLLSARAELPRDLAVQRNLALVRQWLGESDVVPDRLTEPVTALALQLRAEERRGLAGVALGLALLLLAAWRLGWLGRAGVQLAVVLALLGAGLAGASAHAEQARATAAVLLSDATVRGEPDATSEARFVLPEGSEVHAEELRADHWLVQTADGARGWVARPRVAPLDL